MKCPSCDHVSETALLKCGECGETFDRLTLEKYQSVEYLISWLNKQESVVGTAAVSTLQKIALHDRNQIHQHLFPEPAIIELDQPLANTLALLLKTRTLVPQWLEAKVIGMDDAVQINGSLENRAKYIHPKALEAEFNLPDVSIEAARRFAYKSLKVWTQQLYITSTYCELLREHLEGKLGILAVPKAPVPAVAAPVREGSVPESVPQPQNVLHTSAKPIHAVLTPAVPAAQPSRRPRPASSPPRRPPKPPKPPRPKQPPIRWDAIWKKVVDAAVSGLLVRWLRYLGAFLFVMSLAIVVVSFWENIPPLGQVAIIFFIPTLFYGGGLFVRRKLGIEQTGGVLMGVGQLLLAVDFAAIYQFGGLTMDLNVYWLITSIICSLVYLFTVLRLVQDEFFGYIGLAGVSSTAMALVAILAKSPEWPIATLAAFALPSVEIGYRLSKLDKKWAEISRAAFRFTYVVIPVALGLILFVPSPSAPLAQALAFGLATSAYGLLAFRSPNFIHTHLAVWGSMLTVGLTLRAANLEWAWWSLVGTLLAPMYIIFERTIFGRKPKTTSANITHQMAFYLAGFGLLILSIAAGMATTFFDFWPGVFALTAASAVLAVLALPNRHSFYFLSAVGLYLLPFTLTVLRLLMGVPQRFSLLTAAWVGVALLYLAGTALFREKKRYSRWPALLGILIVPVSLAALILFSWIEPWGTSIPALLTIGGAIGFYTFAAVLQYRGKIPALSLWLKLIPKQIRAVLFLTIVGVLLPVWIAVAWLGSVFAPIWLGAVFSGLAILYIGGGQVLYRVRRAYRFPIHVLAYLIGFAAVLFALPDRFSLMSTLYINVVGLVVLAIIYRRAPEASLAAVLFLWPFQLTISIAQIMPHAHSLAYLVLSGVAYIPLGIMMRRKKLGIKFTLPIFIIGYLVSIYGLLVAMLGQYPDFLVSVEWIPVIVPLLATVLYVYSVPLLDRLFSWAAAGAFALAFSQLLWFVGVPQIWFAAAWVLFGIGYLILGMFFEKTFSSINRDSKWRWIEGLNTPMQVGAWASAAWALILTAPLTLPSLLSGFSAFDNWIGFPEAILGQWGLVLFVVFAALLYRSQGPLYLEPAIAFLPVTLMFMVYGESWIGKSLTVSQYGIVWAGLSAVHIVIAVVLDQLRLGVKVEGQVELPRRALPYAHALYFGGYLLGIFSVAVTIPEQTSFLWSLGVWLIVAFGSAVLVHVKRHKSWDELWNVFFEKKSHLYQLIRNAFMWGFAAFLPVWIVVFMDTLRLIDGYKWLGLVVPALLYLPLGTLLRKTNKSYAWPFNVVGHVYTVLGLAISVPMTGRFLFGTYDLPDESLPALSFILLQIVGVAFYALSTRIFTKTAFGYLTAFVASALTVVPFTLVWITFGENIIGRSLAQPEFSVAWMALVFGLVGVGLVLDRKRIPASLQKEKIAFGNPFAHATLFIGYVLGGFASVWVVQLWSDAAMPSFLITLGAWIFLMSVSAVLALRGIHKSWNDLLALLFRDQESRVRTFVNTGFLWLAAFTFPVWLTVFLWELNVFRPFGYLGYVGSALVFLGLAVWLRKRERIFAWPLFAASQFYILLPLINSIELTQWNLTHIIDPILPLNTLAYVIVQSLAVVYFIAASMYLEWNKWIARGFAYAAAMLSVVPWMLGWVTFGPYQETAQYSNFAYPWLLFSAILFLTGYLLDRIESKRKQRIGFAHGPHFVGLLLGGYAYIWSFSDNVTNIYSGLGLLVLTLLSHTAVHFNKHTTFTDFLDTFWRKGETTAKRIVRTGFLFIATYGFPVWLTMVMAYNEVELAWRGLGLALVAPLYIAGGLAARRNNKDYTWSLYSAGYLLTAIGTMISFDNQLLAIYVLSLNVIVYAASAYIFRQAGWLYLSTVLVPIIGIMVIDHNLNALPAPHVAGMLMGMAFAYFGVGWLFQRRKQLVDGISSFALPFFAPGFLISAVALAVASADRELAVLIYLAGVVFYALAAATFKESVFLYPAVWLAAVPYYLGMTYTNLQPAWFGIGWLPLILTAIFTGRVVFHRKPLGFGNEKERLHFLAHPAMPFYTLAYALSLSMMFVARGDMAALTVAFGAATLLYLGTAGLFRTVAWVYPGLLAAHLGLSSYFAIDPQGNPTHYISLPFHLLTWVMGLIGGFMRRREGKWSLSSWATPFLLFTALDVIVWQGLSLFGFETGIIVSTGHALLLGLLGILWVSAPMVWASLGMLTLAIGLRLVWAGMLLPEAAAVVAGVGFGLYFTGRLVEVISGRLSEIGSVTLSKSALSLWGMPLTRLGIGINAVGAATTLLFAFSNTTQTAAGLAFAGALYLAVAYRGKYYQLGYAAVFILELAFVLVLWKQDVVQPQWYAIPAGLYFIGVGVFERRSGRKQFSLLLETFGMAVLLLTSFIQSLNLESGFMYFMLLLVEGMLLIVWGAQQKRKIPFLIGVLAAVLNVAGQLVVLFMGGSTLIRWLIFGGVGLLLLAGALLAERWIIPRAQVLRERLEAWA